MRQARHVSFILFFLGLGLSGLRAQDATLTAGGRANGQGGSVSYSVGQVVYSTFSGSSGTLGQGVQQPYVISVVSGIDQARGIHLKFLAYPNPVTDFLVLQVSDMSGARSFPFGELFYRLYDIGGRLLLVAGIDGSETQVEMGSFASGMYYLKVFNGPQQIKTFKIIKN
jgi:hypothetical protein